MSVGRYATVAVVLIAFCWIPIIAQQKGGLFLVTQTAMSHLAPPISALFVAGLFIKRANGRGAFTGLMCGTLFGVIRLTDFLFNHNKCTADDVTNKAVRHRHRPSQTQLTLVFLRCLSLWKHIVYTGL